MIEMNFGPVTLLFTSVFFSTKFSSLNLLPKFCVKLQCIQWLLEIPISVPLYCDLFSSGFISSQGVKGSLIPFVNMRGINTDRLGCAQL